MKVSTSQIATTCFCLNNLSFTLHCPSTNLLPPLQPPRLYYFSHSLLSFFPNCLVTIQPERERHYSIRSNPNPDSHASNDEEIKTQKTINPKSMISSAAPRISLKKETTRDEAKGPLLTSVCCGSLGGAGIAEKHVACR